MGIDRKKLQDIIMTVGFGAVWVLLTTRSELFTPRSIWWIVRALVISVPLIYLTKRAKLIFVIVCITCAIIVDIYQKASA